MIKVHPFFSEKSNKDHHVSVLRRLFSLRAFILCSFVLYATFFNPQPDVFVAVSVLIAASILFSFFSWNFNRNSQNYILRTHIFQLLWDSGVILVFVWFAGRSLNPFIYYQLLVIAISASILPEKFAWFFSGLGIAAYSVLIYLDVGHHMSHMDASFKSHLISMWVNFTGSAVLIAFFVSRLSSALRQREEALHLAREKNLENEQLIGIGTLAASTVHSFGTPLSAITMAASEIDALHSDEDTHHCTKVIKSQIERCKETMGKLSSLSDKAPLDDQRTSIEELSREMMEYLTLVNVSPMPSVKMAPELVMDQSLPGGILLLHAVINLVDNAIDAADEVVMISMLESPVLQGLRIIIEDDGEGIPFDESGAVDSKSSKKETGLGIGLMLVNSTIERLGGTVSFKNPSELQSATQITIDIPYAA